MKRTLVVAFLVAFALWPAVQIGLTHRYGADPWRLFAWDLTVALLASAAMEAEDQETLSVTETYAEALAWIAAQGPEVGLRGLASCTLRVEMAESALQRLEQFVDEHPEAPPEALDPHLVEGALTEALRRALEDERAHLLEQLGLVDEGRLRPGASRDPFVLASGPTVSGPELADLLAAFERELEHLASGTSGSRRYGHFESSATGLSPKGLMQHLA